MSDEIVVFVTAGSGAEADRIGETLVKEKLIACANITTSVKSIFHWQGELCTEDERLMILKSTRRNLNRIVERVKELHSYDVPEIIALPIVAGSSDYLQWLNDETAGG